MTFPEAVHTFIDLTTRFVAPMPIATEWVIAALAVLLIAVAPIGSSRFLNSLRDSFRRLANRKRLAIAICGILPVAIRLSLLGFAPVPDPSIHDEFSHLLLGDTLGARTFDESHSSDVGTLRNHPCHSAANLQFDVSAGAGSVSGAG